MGQIFNDLKDQIIYNKTKIESGGVTSISPPFQRLSKKYPGWVKGRQTLITASSGVSKTKFTKFLAVTSVVDFIKTRKDVTAKVFFFALEESKEQFWLSIKSNLLFTRFGISISPTELMSQGEYTISQDVLDKIDLIESDIDFMESIIEVIDNIYNPYGIYKHVRDYFETAGIGKYEEATFTNDKGLKQTVKNKFIYDNPDHYVFVITDQINLLVPDQKSEFGAPQSTLHDAMNEFSKTYCLKHMVKRMDCVVINVQQQAGDQEKQEFHRGSSIEKKLEPSLSGLADSKLTQRDCDLVIGLFAPARYELTNYRNYDITRLNDSYRCAIILKDRHFGIANAYIHLYFNGATNVYKELPHYKDMTDEIYEKINNKTF